MVDRRVGHRRDATRAPTQARNGWRPHGRRLGQPATPSKDGRNFVQTMGSTSLRHSTPMKKSGSQIVGLCYRIEIDCTPKRWMVQVLTNLPTCAFGKQGAV